MSFLQCPDCGYQSGDEVATVENLRAENVALKAELAKIHMVRSHEAYVYANTVARLMDLEKRLEELDDRPDC